MPRFDGTGPRGAGPRTRQRQGLCEPGSGICCGLGRGLGPDEQPGRVAEGVGKQRSTPAALNEAVLGLLKRVGW